MASYKCIYCQHSDGTHRRWPYSKDFGVCPCCRESAEHSFLDPTLTTEEAHRDRRNFVFGWWLWDTGRMAS